MTNATTQTATAAAAQKVTFEKVQPEARGRNMGRRKLAVYPEYRVIVDGEHVGNVRRFGAAGAPWGGDHKLNVWAGKDVGDDKNRGHWSDAWMGGSLNYREAAADIRTIAQAKQAK